MMVKNMWGLALVGLVSFGIVACGGDAGTDEETPAAQAAVVAADAGDMEAADASDMEAADVDAMPQELPEGVTPAMVEEGKGIFSGAGICMSCHGPNGEGIEGLGANLTDDEWLHSDGEYESIVQSIMDGVTAQESSSGVPMPAKGGTAISDEQVRAVAAYVWTLSK